MNSAAPTPHNPICVIGGGLVGLLVTLSLASAVKVRSERVTLVAPSSESSDGRTTAMLMPSIEILEQLGVWESVEPASAALKTMRLIDGSKRLVRAPVIDFRSSEVELEAFGFNVPNARLARLLEDALEELGNVDRVSDRVKSSQCGNEGVKIETENNEVVECALAVAADGRNSIIRQAAGIETKEWSYPQTALVLTFAHSVPHGGVSAEFHTETGPFTQVPLPPTVKCKHRSSLVWVVKPEDADEIARRPLSVLSRDVEEKLQSSFGKVTVESSPQAFPLSGLTAKKFGANSVVLVGEAAHVFPPIGAQGFNLGVRDIETLTKLLVQQSDYGDLPRLYDKSRTADVHLRTVGVDVLNRSLLTDFLPVQLARAAGISTLCSSRYLRKLAIKGGLGGGVKPQK